MKTSLLTITFSIVLASILVGTASTSHAVVANSISKNCSFTSTNIKEVIIQVADMNEKNLVEIRKNIEFSGGMTFRGYYKDLKVLLYLMDTDQHQDCSFLNTAFMNLSMGYLLKEGTILQVQNACATPLIVDPFIDPNHAQD